MNIESTSITVSSNAIKRIQGLLPDQQSNFFRVYVTGGGCSGFQYGFKFDDNPAGDDDILDFEVIINQWKNLRQLYSERIRNEERLRH